MGDYCVLCCKTSQGRILDLIRDAGYFQNTPGAGWRVCRESQGCWRGDPSSKQVQPKTSASQSQARILPRLVVVYWWEHNDRLGICLHMPNREVFKNQNGKFMVRLTVSICENFRILFSLNMILWYSKRILFYCEGAENCIFQALFVISFWQPLQSDKP